jgi:hypothetical protein
MWLNDVTTLDHNWTNKYFLYLFLNIIQEIWKKFDESVINKKHKLQIYKPLKKSSIIFGHIHNQTCFLIACIKFLITHKIIFHYFCFQLFILSFWLHIFFSIYFCSIACIKFSIPNKIHVCLTLHGMFLVGVLVGL